MTLKEIAEKVGWNFTQHIFRDGEVRSFDIHPNYSVLVGTKDGPQNIVEGDRVCPVFMTEKEALDVDILAQMEHYIDENNLEPAGTRLDRDVCYDAEDHTYCFMVAY